MVALCGGCRRVKGFHFLVNEGTGRWVEANGG